MMLISYASTAENLDSLVGSDKDPFHSIKPIRIFICTIFRKLKGLVISDGGMGSQTTFATVQGSI